VESVLSGLNNPCGIAVQPGTGHVFVSDSGALRVVKFDPAGPGKALDVITGFPRDVYGKGPMYDIGPLGLAFLDQNTLVVGGGGQIDGKELLRVYDVSSGNVLKAADMKHSLGPIGPGDESIKGEGNFYGVAVTKTAIYVTSNGDDTKGWLARAVIKGGTPAGYAPFIATKVATNVDAPVGITVNKRGLLVVGQMGEINVPKDSLLTYYNPKNKKLLSKYETGLYDIAALAYSASGRLYAVDFAWMATDQGGVFRLDRDGDDGVKAVKIAGLDKATAIASDGKGALYVTVFGTAKEGQKTPGTVVKITGKL